MATKKLLTVSSVARALGLKPATLRSEIEAGTLPGVKVGEEFLVSLQDIERALLKRASLRKQAGGKGVARAK
jgi:excisionase family DNA binding protein